VLNALRFAPEATKNNTVVYEAAGDKVKITVDSTDKDGKSMHNEWTGKFDGNDYPVTGDPISDMRSYKKVDDRTLKMTLKKDGKVRATGRIVVSGRRQIPYGHHERNRCGRQKRQKHGGVRQVAHPSGLISSISPSISAVQGKVPRNLDCGDCMAHQALTSKCLNA
jgi:hypothetical protein